jgi:hypothetical protein
MVLICFHIKNHPKKSPLESNDKFLEESIRIYSNEWALIVIYIDGVVVEGIFLTLFLLFCMEELQFSLFFFVMEEHIRF